MNDMDTEALIAAVRAGDIEAAQALLPVDPIVKRAREICARHMGTPSRWLDGSHDDGPYMGAVSEALRTPAPPDADTVLRIARAVCYAMPPLVGGNHRHDYLSGSLDGSWAMTATVDALQAALAGA